jgi:two-component system response regulator
MVKGEPIIILFVEDDPAHAEIVRRNLESLRVAHRLIRLTDGQAAMDYLFRQNGYTDAEANPLPHIILLDLRLPKVDGIEVLRRIKTDDELKRIPVVVLTTSSAEADMVSAYNNGADSYLVKPGDFRKFTKLLDAFVFYWLAWNKFPGRRHEDISEFGVRRFKLQNR